MTKRLFEFRAIAFAFILLALAVSALAQTSDDIGVTREAVDTAIQPHDFKDKYYLGNGINPEAIIGRRTGTDGLSVFDGSSVPYHNEIRVTATMPAYNLNGEPLFWYLLGELTVKGFTEDQAGMMAREHAKAFPIYIFPGPFQGKTILDNNRQAALIDDSWRLYSKEDPNPLGVREVYTVIYTKKAFTREAEAIMQEFAKKNGLSADDTPIIRSMDDINYLWKRELISVAQATTSLYDDTRSQAQFMIAPVIQDPTGWTIAKDAFLWMATRDDKPLDSEEIFINQFTCLKGTGEWCK